MATTCASCPHTCPVCCLPLEHGLMTGKIVHANGSTTCPITWRDAEKVIKKNFPKTIKITRVCASVIKALDLGILTQPLGVLAVGVPSGQKTTALRFFKLLPGTEWLDDFSGASFVSHQPGKKEEELRENDLLPKLKNKALIVPEFSSVLEGNREKIADKLGRLTRIMDGDGFRSASGTHGIRGYEGRHDFVFLAATVPLTADNWDSFVRAGARFMFVNSTDGLTYDDLLENDKYLSAIAEIQQLVGSALLVKSAIPTITEEQKRGIYELASWVARLRGVVSVKGTRFIDTGGSERTSFQTDQPIIEAPPRLFSMFCVLTQGHAALYQKSAVDAADLAFLFECAKDCGRYDRVRLLFSMPSEPTTVKEMAEKLKVSRDTIRRKLAELNALGLVEVGERLTLSDKNPKTYKPLLFANARFTLPENQQTTLNSGQEGGDDMAMRSLANNKGVGLDCAVGGV